jgi:thymidine kinase
MIHCGESGEDWRILHKRLRRIDFLSDRQLSLQAAKQTMTENVCAEEAFDTFLKPYSAILVDEAHLLSVEQLKILEECKNLSDSIFYLRILYHAFRNWANFLSENIWK